MIFLDLKTKELFKVSPDEYMNAVKNCAETQQFVNDRDSNLKYNFPFVVKGHSEWIYKSDENYSEYGVL